MNTQFDSKHVERSVCYRIDADPDDPKSIQRVDVTLTGEYVINLDVFTYAGPTTSTPVDFMASDEAYAIARDAARSALRQFKVKVSDLAHLDYGARLVTMFREEHQQVRAAELAEAAASGTRARTRH